MLHNFHYFPLLLLIMNYKCATMLSCDIIPCKGGHLEERKIGKNRNDYTISPTHNNISATCH